MSIGYEVKRALSFKALSDYSRCLGAAGACHLPSLLGDDAAAAGDRSAAALQCGRDGQDQAALSKLLRVRPWWPRLMWKEALKPLMKNILVLIVDQTSDFRRWSE